jgi:hypothetical protein
MTTLTLIVSIDDGGIQLKTHVEETLLRIPALYKYD